MKAKWRTYGENGNAATRADAEPVHKLMTFGELDLEDVPVLRAPSPDEAGGPIGCEVVLGLLKEEMGVLNDAKVRTALRLLSMFKNAEQERFWQMVLADERLAKALRSYAPTLSQYVN